MAKNNKWIWSAVVLLVLASAAGGFWLSKTQSNSDVQTLKQDTFGGKTKEETLNLFVSALEKGDTRLASRYFYPVGNIKQSAWEKSFNEIKNGNLTDGMIKDIKDEIKSYLADDRNSPMVLKLNSYTGVWKIESI